MSKANAAPLALMIAGAVGLLGVFLPLDHVGSYWAFHNTLSIGGTATFSPFLALGLFALTVTIGALATFDTTRAVYGISGLVLGALLFLIGPIRNGLFGDADGLSGIGGVVMFLSALVVPIAAIGVLIKGPRNPFAIPPAPHGSSAE